MYGISIDRLSYLMDCIKINPFCNSSVCKTDAEVGTLNILQEAYKAGNRIGYKAGWEFSVASVNK